MNNPPIPVLRLRTHSPKWFIFIPGQGETKPYWLSTRTTDEAEARALLESVKASGFGDAASAMRRDAMVRLYWRRLVKGRTVLVCKAADEYLAELALRGLAPRTLVQYRDSIDLWVRFAAVGRSSLSSITMGQIAPWINTTDPIAYTTRGRRLMVLRDFFDYCVEKEFMPINFCRQMYVRTAGIPQDKLVPKKRSAFTDEEIATLLSKFPKDSWWYGAVLLGKYFGLRLSAVAALEWASLPELKRIRIFTHKARVVVDEPLPEELATWLSAWPRSSDSGYCFPEAAAYIDGVQSNALSAIFIYWCRKFGIQGRSFHCLRVRVATNGINKLLDQLGGEEKAVMSALLVRHGMAGVQKIIGHVGGSSVTAARYFNPAPAPTT